MSLEELERLARKELEQGANLPRSIRPWLLFVLSLPSPYVLTTAVLFVPLLGLILTLINLLLWLKAALSFPPRKFLLPSLGGMVGAVLVLPFSRWGLMILTAENRGGVVAPSAPMPVIGYVLLASTVFLSLAYLLGLSALLWCRVNMTTPSARDGF